MSWKRIFRTARKVGAPVIIADENGKRPQVVLPLDIYEALIDDDRGFEMIDEDDFEEDFDASKYLEDLDIDEESDQISEIKFDDGDDENDSWNEAEYMNQYRKKRSEGYSDSEIVKKLDQEGWGWNGFGLDEPDEKAAPAFEFEDSLGSEELSPMDIPEIGETEMGAEVKEVESERTSKSSKISEEMAVEDRFYFEPVDDEEVGS
ncbi:MAG: hypothetical protein P1P90_01205 [Patescibacteria group bacterium]|nr:hypothetical protein [Patescibacteria group bacterium]